MTFSAVVVCAAASVLIGTNTDAIDRKALVTRHDVKLTAADPLSPLSVGNGRFAFNADVTGLQTFPAHYANTIPLTTMAEWGWNRFENTEGYTLADTFVKVDTYGREVQYNIISSSPAAQYLRANPHQTHLGQIGFVLTDQNGRQLTVDDLSRTDQTLHLWEGQLVSRFVADGQPVQVQTVAHPEFDGIAVSVDSPLLRDGRAKISLRFAYPSATWGNDPADWTKPTRHQTQTLREDETTALIRRQLDSLSYYCRVGHNGKLLKTDRHEYLLFGPTDGGPLTFSVIFSQTPIDQPAELFEQICQKAAAFWQGFWTSGGAIDLSESSDPRWYELERRIVLSQYLMGVQSAQQYPPAETGLTCTSWFGKFHLEMHWWHGVHWMLWGRSASFERSLAWYKKIMPVARQIAQRQGYAGVRWPKMVGPDGHDSPSGIGPLLIWQQPHPIYYAEMLYRENPTAETLDHYKDLVFETAAFMADFAHWDEMSESFVLGPPLISAREFEPKRYAETKNPAFELAYWHWALRTACQWRQRLGLEPAAMWERIAANLALLPIRDGVYVEQEYPPVADGGHPCMLAAWGLLPKSQMVEEAVMTRTVEHVLRHWDWRDTWGWDYPMIAMTAARVGKPEWAIEALLLEVQKNRYLPNGHNWQREGLPVYMPGNGGLLTAVAMMAAGWDDAPQRNAPGFPDNGKWVVKWEGLRKMP